MSINDEPITINEFADMYGLDVAAVILSIIKYLVDDPTLIHRHVRQVLLTTSNDEIEEALATIADDLKSTGSKEAIR